MNRAERRRRARADRKQPVIIAGDGIVAAELSGHRYEARPHAQLPAKRPGKHRWVAIGAWVLSDLAVAAAHDADTMKFLDSENLMSLGIGCWDCDQPLGVIKVDSTCPAEAYES